MADTPIDRLRAICLALPEATEKLTWGEHVTFRVRDKIFAMDSQHDDRVSMTCKAPPGAQDALVRGEPDRFFVPAYVGGHGWVGMHLDSNVNWEHVSALVEESYRMTAPRRLTTLLDQG